MNLYVKVFLILGMASILSLAILLVTSHVILLNSFAKLEEQITGQNVQRVLSATSSDVESLDTFTHDWSSWDDTYNFIQDRNTEYIQVNLIDDTFINAKLNLMLFINTSGELVFGKAFDLQNMTETSIPQSLAEKFGTNDTLWHFPNESSSIKGFILLPEGPMMLVSRPILTSNSEGPVQGALIMGRFFDSSEVARVSNETQLPLSVERLDDPNLPPDFQSVYMHLIGENPIFVQPLNNEIISGYALIKDIYGQPILVLRADLPRNIYNQGFTSVNYFLFSLGGLLIALGIYCILFFEKTVLAPIRRLSVNVTNIAKNGEISARVDVKGKDEISDLASAINKMLASLENSQFELNESTKRLEQAKLERLAAVGQAAAMVGHDLRNPLTSIMGATYFLNERLKGKLDDKSAEALEIIDKDVGYSTKIINDLLDYSREISLETEETDMQSIVQEVLTGISVPGNVQVYNQTWNTPKIWVDSVKVKRVFSNLVKNAIEAMPEGGTLTINSQVVDNNLQISFTDTGTGIPPEILGKLWTPFFTTKSKGLGLGLAICKRIIEAHGGKIFTESTVGKGTTFRIMLPIKLQTSKEAKLLPEVSPLPKTVTNLKQRMADRKN